MPQRCAGHLKPPGAGRFCRSSITVKLRRCRRPKPMRCSDDEIRLTNENENLRFLLEQELKSASELDTAEKLQRIVLEELHQRVKNMLTTVQAITLRSI